MKGCINCRHLSHPWGPACEHPKAAKDDFMYGKVAPYPPRGAGEVCGPDAVLFEPRQKRRSLFKRLFGPSPTQAEV